MRSSVLCRWVLVALALAAVGTQTAQAEGGTWLAAASAEGVLPGAWVLVQPKEGRGSWPWQLAQVKRAEAGSLELSRPLKGKVPAADAQVLVLELAEASDVLSLEALRSGVPVRGGSLLVEGKARAGSQVLVLIEGVEGARVEADPSGRFAADVAMPHAPGRYQLQVISGLGGAWSLHPESTDVVILAPPATPLVAEPQSGGFINDTTPLFRGTADPGTTVIIAINGTDVGSTTVDSSGNWSFSPTTALVEGPYTASARAQASNGETSGLFNLSFTVDITPPRTSFTLDQPTRTTSRSARFRFISTEFGSFECSLDGGSYQACTSPYQINDLPDGEHVFRVRSRDRAGNVEQTPATDYWTIDTVPPVTRIVDGPPRRSREQRVSFTLEASEEIERFECLLDGQQLPSGDCGTVTVAVNLTEGSHTLQARAVDFVGLAGEFASYEWVTDLTPPPTPVLQQPSAGAPLNSRTPAISGTAEPGSTVTITITISQTNERRTGTATADAAGSWAFTPSSELADGDYQLALQARDEAGNVNSNFSTVSFSVDATPPDTSIIEGPASVIYEPNLKFSFQASEQVEEFQCKLNEQQEFQPCPQDLVNGTRRFEPGGYTLQVRARDRAGNVDPTPAVRQWTYSIGYGAGGGCSAAGASQLLPLGLLVVLLRRRRQQVSPRAVAQAGGLLALLGGLLAGSALAQAVDLQQYKPAPGSRDILGVYNPQVGALMSPRIGLSFNYAQNPLVLRAVRDGGLSTSIVSNQATVDVLGSVALAEWFELGVAVPVALQGTAAPGAFAPFVPSFAAGNGLGDLRLVPKAVLPLSTGLDVGLVLPLSLPTSTGPYLGAPGVGIQPTAMLRWAPLSELSLLANAGVRLQPESRIELLDLTVGNELTYALGAYWSPGGSPWSARASLEGASGFSGGRASQPLELLGAVGYTLENGATLQLGGGPGFGGGYGTPSFRLFASLGWTPPTPRPPLLCSADPALDPDGDGLANKDDRCPYVAAAAGNGQSTDGCPASPRSAEVSEWVALLTQDKDSDGLMDAGDQCVSEAEDVDGFLDDDGCAERDNDKDAIADDKDECRDEPEVKNGYKDEDGCWDDSRLKIARIKDQLIVEDVIFGSGNANLNTASTDRLRKVATALRDAWRGQLEKLEVRGYHRSGQNPSDREQTLLQQRADKVATELGAAEFNLAKPEHLWIPSVNTFNRNTVRIEFTLRQPPPASQVARQLPLALLRAAVGEVKTGATEQELKPLAAQGAVMDGSVLVVAAGGRAELGLADGRTLRVAPGSELRMKAGSSKEQPVQLEWVRGWGETDKGVILFAPGTQRLEEPKIFPACEGSFAQAPRLAWKEVPKASRYQVELARDAEFISGLRLESTREAHLTPEGLQEGSWYWRVLPVYGEDSVGLPSRVYSFVIEPSKALTWR